MWPFCCRGKTVFQIYIFLMFVLTLMKKKKNGPRPSARFRHSACALDEDRMLVFGGVTSSGLVNDVYVFDLGEKKKRKKKKLLLCSLAATCPPPSFSSSPLAPIFFFCWYFVHWPKTLVAWAFCEKKTFFAGFYLISQHQLGVGDVHGWCSCSTPFGHSYTSREFCVCVWGIITVWWWAYL